MKGLTPSKFFSYFNDLKINLQTKAKEFNEIEIVLFIDFYNQIYPGFTESTFFIG